MRGPLSTSTVIGGDFRVIRPLSSGGMGAVYVAEQITTGKLRALKVMHAQLVDDATQRERFIQEARVAAHVESEHVVDVLAAGVEFDSGAPWLAMELLEGCDLKQLVKSHGPVELDHALPIVEQLCHGLAAAHDEGVVHRDLKPQNIFFTKLRSAAQPWTVKILDFGIAKVMADATMAETAALGSPTWMAPEQTETSSSIAPATDVWALGLLVFWMLTSRSYWRAANDKDGSFQAVLREMLFEPLDPPSARARNTAGAAPFPEELDSWFLRCIERMPEDRYPNAREAWQALAAKLDRAAPPSHVLPMEVASLVLEAALPLDGSAATSSTVGGADTPATEVVEVPSAEPRAVLTAAKSSPDEDDDAPGDDERGEGIDGDIGETLQSHEIVSRRASADEGAMPKRRARRWQSWLFGASLLGGAIAALIAFGGNGPAETPPPPTSSGNATTAEAPGPSVAAPTAASADGGAPVPLRLLEHARKALHEGRIDEAERVAAKALEALGSVVGSRPEGAPVSLIGAQVQRVLVQVPLARAAARAPLRKGGSFADLDAVIAAREPLLLEAQAACGKAGSWSDGAEAACCRLDIATHLLDLAEVARARGSARHGSLIARARRELDGAREGEASCDEALTAARRRATQLRSPVPTASSQGPAKRPPFDAGKAQQSLAAAQARARTVCGSLGSAKSYTFTVMFGSSTGGAVVIGGPSGNAASCIANQLRTARIEPFDPATMPPRQTVTVALK